MSLAKQVGEETPDIYDIIEMAIRSNQLELNTCMPGIVKAYDAATQTASVQPSFKRMRLDTKEFTSRAVIDDVPIVFPISNGKGVVFPIAVGDPVMIVFSQRSLDTWLDNGGEIDLQDTRLHNVNDAIAIPGLDHAPISPAPSQSTELRGTKIFVGDPDGSGVPEVLLSKSDAIQAIAKIIEQILSLPLESVMGPVTFNATVQTNLNKIKTMIEGFEE